MKHILTLLFCLVIIPCSAHLEKDLKKLTMLNGLPDNTIYDIASDSDGFIWFATERGICRYNGTTLRSFQLPTQNKTAHRLIMNGKDYIWVESLGGTLNCFDRQSEKFITINNKLTKDIWSFNCKGDKAYIMRDKSVIMAQIEYIKDSSQVSLNLIHEYKLNLDYKESLHSIAIDSDDTIYGITFLNKIIKIDPQTGEYSTQQLTIKDIRIPNRTSHIQRFDIIGNSIWICTLNGGVVRYFKHDGRYLQICNTEHLNEANISKNISKHQLAHSGVYYTSQIDSSKYILATWNGYSELQFDEQDSELLSIKNFSNSYSELHQSLESRIISIHFDRNRILWLGTFGGGVYCSDLREQFYEQYHQKSSNEISQMAFDNSGHLWISSFYKGIQRSVKPFTKGEPLNFQDILAKENIQGEQPTMAMCSDSRGRVWVGSTRNTLIVFENDGKTRKEYNILPQYNTTIRTILSDNQGRIWVGHTNGLLLFDPITQKSYPQNDIDSNATINSIISNGNGILYISTTKGLIKYDPDTKTVHKYCQSFNILSSAFDSRGNIYLGTTNGFALFNPQDESIKIFNTQKGLSNNYVACVVVNKKNEVWLGHNSGISRFLPKEEIFYNYYIQGSNRSGIISDYGILVWGNNKSISYFDPNTLSTLFDQMQSQPIVISDIEIGGDLVSVGDTINNQVILQESMNYTKKIELNAENNNFSLHVSNLLFNPTYHNYDYRLLPIQKQWITVKHGERISYVALPAGNYIFQIKGHSAQNNRNQITELAITIHNYWFFSWWIKILLLLIMVAAIVYSFLRFRKRYNRQLYVSKLRGELNVQRMELEKERQINKDRVNFFTYASHELRTPLTLVLSPLQELLSESNIDDKVRNRLQIVERNASQLLKLASKLLYLQKIEAKMVDLDISRVDIWSMLSSVVESFSIVAKENNVRIITKNLTNTKSVYAYVDFDKIESVITNLISNSIKYRGEDDAQVLISVETKLLQEIEYLIITVQDNGQGIAKEKQKTIFEYFTTDNNRPVFSNKTGIGLFIVRSIVESHHGKVTLESDKGKGATFKLHIPLDNYHFKTTPDIKPANHETVVKRQTILIVEDNLEILDYICSLFDNEYRVLRAIQGSEGLQLAAKELPELIIHDVMLPDMSGIECCRILYKQDNTSHIPVIILSAKSDEQTMVECTIVGAADYLIKPFNPRILKAKVQALIRSRAMISHIYTKSLMLSNVEGGNNSKSDNFIQKIINITETNLTNNEFSVDVLAQMLNLSTSTLRRTLKNHTTLSVNEVIRSVRLTKAASLLLEEEYRINEVAELVGYNDISTFRSQFIKKFGISPSKFQSDKGQNKQEL